MKDSKIERIFSAAAEKVSPPERAAYLDGACGSDADLRGRVETLLRAHDDAGRFLDPTSDHATAEGPGTAIGRYKLLQSIGEGGFGVVYMAEQIEPVRRKVALKIIKLGMDTRQVVARFESERQALALMDHPNIARVLDGGATESGRPYFVMELVKGIPITDYCDQNNLATRDRLDLFILTCQAVQHAHQKGVIHRDLKPTNVLVTLHDGRPVPKVIDFGIAKATNQRLTEKTLFTEFRQFIGTPQYTSPEQAEMSGLDVDTRSDIYSLGVLLYELLTGTTPFGSDRLRTAGYVEMQRIIREEEPPSPSVRLSTMHDQLATLAKHRSIEPDSLSKQISGDLDWIVMKCLEKDRTRRYETANDLVADVQRHLHNEPVHASPPSAAYRLRKFVRRNKLGVTAAGLVAAALCLGLALATAGFVHARHEAERANDARAAADQQAARATREAERSKAIADFLQEILASSDPKEAASRNADVEHVLNRARELFGSDHATVAATLSSLALQLQNSGNADAAEPLYRESIRIWQQVYGEDHANVAITLTRLGTLLRRNKADNAGAEQAFRDALRIGQRLRGELGLVTCDARTQLAELLQKQNKLDEAESLLREAVAIRREQPVVQQTELAVTLEQLCGVLEIGGKFDASETAYEEMLEAYREVFPRDSSSLALMNAAFGHLLTRHGKLDRAEPYFREAVRICRAIPDPPREFYVLATDGLVKILISREQHLDESIGLFHELMTNLTSLYGRDHLLLAPPMFNFAKMLEDRDRAVEGIPLIVEGIRIYRKSRGPDWDAGPSLRMLERFVRRVALAPGLPKDRYEIALQGAETLAAEDPQHPGYTALVGMSHFRLGRLDDARKQLARTPGNGDSPPADQFDHRPQQLAFLAMTQFRSGDVEQARMTLDELHELVKQKGTPSKDDKSAVAEAEALVSGKALK